MNRRIFIILLSLSIIIPSFALLTFCNNVYAQQQGKQHLGAENITLYDPNLKIELVTSGLDFPTTMAFLGPDDFLILEKNTGNVKRVINGNLIEKPVLHVNPSIKDERGLLGIAVSEKKNFYDYPFFIENKKLTHNVFLYYIECNDKKNLVCENHVYRYDLNNQKNELVNPRLLLAIPSFPDPSHVGGIIDIGPDNNLYVTVGNFQNTIPSKVYKTLTQNFGDGEPVDGRAGILWLTEDGYPVMDYNGSSEEILGNEYPLNLYYAYGVKNSFGIDFDPVTGKLWDTENGPQFGDEINLAEPGFNSGADKVYGIWQSNEFGDRAKNKKGEYVTVADYNPDDLVYFNGKGHYSSPEFIWVKTVAPTALLFLDSDKLGSEYKNDIFVGSADGGRLFHFDLNDARNGLDLKGNLTDKIAVNSSDFGDILFAEGFSIITDVKQGPDGYLYVVSGLKQSKTAKFGAVFRIMPLEEANNTTSDNITIQQEYMKQSNDDDNDDNRIKYNTTTYTNLDTKIENVPKKMDTTNVLSAIAPKLSNTTKIIDVKAWDNLFKKN